MLVVMVIMKQLPHLSGLSNIGDRHIIVENGDTVLRSSVLLSSSLLSSVCSR